MSKHAAHKKSLFHVSQGMKSAVAYASASLFSKGLAFITMPIFTRIMTTSEIGTVNLYNSWQSTLTVIATLALTYGGYMVALREFEHERDQYQSSVLALTSIMSILLSITYFIAPNFWSNILGLDKSLIILMLFGFLVSPATEFWLARQRYEYRYIAASIVTIGSAIIASLLSIFVVLVLNEHGSDQVAEGRLFANFSVLYLVAFVLWCFIMIRGRVFVNLRYWKFSLALSLPLIVNQFAMQVMNNSGRVMIGWYVNKSAVGIYGTLASISTICTIIWGAINSSFIPFMYRNLSDKKGQKKIRELSRLLLIAYAVACVLIVYLAPEIIRILATEEYYEAIFIMPVIAAAIFQNAISNMYANVLLYDKSSSYIMISSLIGAAVNVILNVVLIPFFGYQAAAYAMLFSYIILSYSQMIVSRRVHKRLSGNEKSVYDDKSIIFIQILEVLISIFAVFLYNYFMIRYLAIVVLLIALVFMLVNVKKNKMK